MYEIKQNHTDVIRFTRRLYIQAAFLFAAMWPFVDLKADSVGKSSPYRLVVFDGENLAKKNSKGEQIDIADEDWVTSPYYYGSEKNPFTGDVILPDFQNTNDVSKAIFAIEKGHQNGRTILLHENKKLSAEGLFEEGSLKTANGWHPNGEKRFEAKFADGKLASLELWKDDGEKVAVG